MRPKHFQMESFPRKFAELTIIFVALFFSSGNSVRLLNNQSEVFTRKEFATGFFGRII